MSIIFLNTNVAIQILNGNNSLKDLIDKLNADSFGITTPSIFELYHGLYKLRYLKKNISNKEYKKLSKDLENFIKQLTIYSLDENAANLGAKLHMELKERKRSRNRRF